MGAQQAAKMSENPPRLRPSSRAGEEELTGDHTGLPPARDCVDRRTYVLPKGQCKAHRARGREWLYSSGALPSIDKERWRRKTRMVSLVTPANAMQLRAGLTKREARLFDGWPSQIEIRRCFSPLW